jgi:hypothetical protein
MLQGWRTQGCNNIVISWPYRTCWSNLVTSLIISTRLLQIVNSLFQTCWQLVDKLVTRYEIFACVYWWNGQLYNNHIIHITLPVTWHPCTKIWLSFQEFTKPEAPAPVTPSSVNKELLSDLKHEMWKFMKVEFIWCCYELLNTPFRKVFSLGYRAWC